MSRVYTGLGRSFQEITALPMDEEALADIGRRIKLQPHFLGEPLVVIGEGVDFPGVVDPRTHTLVALDALGRSTAIALTVGSADIDVATPAILLASHVADMAASDLGKIAAGFVVRPANESLLRLWEEMDVEMNDETVELSSLLAAAYERDAEDFRDILNQGQRVVLAAEGYTQRLVRMIQWLNASGVPIAGLRYRRYLVGGQEVYFAEQVVPSVDPAVDAPRAEFVPQETVEPWRTKGRIYHIERLAPRLANLLDELILATRENTFSVNWSHPSYFWIRGPRRNFRVRTYHRDRIDLGFYNAAPAATAAFLAPYALPDTDIVSVGGYADSPFVSLTAETRIDARWRAMLNDWLTGAPPGRSLPGGSLTPDARLLPSERADGAGPHPRTASDLARGSVPERTEWS